MKFAFTALLAIASVPAFAVTFTGDEADKLVKGSDKVVIDDKRHTISFVHYRVLPGSADHNAFLKEVLGAGTETEFQLYQSETDKLGWTNFRYRQLYRNVPVEGAVFYVHVKDGKILSVNGEYYTGFAVNPSPALSSSAAEVTGRNELHAKRLADPGMLEPTTLVVFRDNATKFHLAWKVDAWSHDPMKRSFYFVDAHSGKIAGEHAHMCAIDVQGTAACAFNGSQTVTTDSIAPGQYRLLESGRNIHTHAPGPLEITDTDNFWTNTANYDDYALDAHWGAEMTYDFFLTSFGRVAQDNAGMLVDVQAHDGLYVNAFWTGTYMAFGDGDASQYYPLTSLEIVGHEYAHGVTEFSAGLIYSGESGALNESFSDIFGNTIRFLFSPANATWFIGDEIVIPSMGGQPFRNMANPNQFQCADTYGGLFFNNGDIVHYDSGIQNYWYYLLCMGGSGTNDIGNNFSVSGIGIADASQITYRNLATYLTPNSTFADARLYAEQAAADLFGTCSSQLIQTANAWYAVGIGAPFSGAVVAGFTPSPTISCSAPASVSFQNGSWNGSTYIWDFGDGNFSTAVSPTHIYTNPGTYNVTLIVNGTGNCIGADTLVINSAVTVNNVPGPLPSSCNPGTSAYCCGYGITNVSFNTISWTSPDAIDGYSDFTCADSSLLVAGNPYPVSISTNATTGYDENVKAWIDYNNDGQFNNTNELVYADTTSGNAVHTGIVNTPTTATLNTRLRMRVISDASTNPISSACYAPQRGQAEDYMVYFVANTLPPVAMFTSNLTTVPVGGTVNFTDLTVNAPTSWNWTFSGGIPGNSPVQNPAGVQYNTAGVYPVKLVATNSFGADSVVQTTYINVVNTANICQTAAMSSPAGTIYDSGGPNGNYVDNENCTFLIDPCGSGLTLSFSQFDLENSWDYLYVYDGTSTAAPLLGAYTGNVLPPTLSSASGSFFIVFSSDVSITRPGFTASWSSTPVGTAPAASFSYTPSTPVMNAPVQFTDQSLNTPTSWYWDFGDATISMLQNPQHTYTTSGTFTVTLIVTNCVSSDTTTFVLTVVPVGIGENSAAGDFSIFPNPFSSGATILLGDAIDLSRTRIELCDVSGRKVYDAVPQSRSVPLNRNTLSPGMYFLNVYSSGKLAGTRKVVISD